MKLFFHLEGDDGNVHTIELAEPDREALLYVGKLVKSVTPTPTSLVKVRIKAPGKTKIDLIKVVRTLTGLGLKEAKDVAEGVDRGDGPGVVFKGITRVEATEVQKNLESVGATVVVEAVR